MTNRKNNHLRVVCAEGENLMSGRLQAAWESLNAASAALHRTHNDRKAAKINLVRKNQLHARNRQDCKHAIAELDHRIETALRERRQLSASTADEYKQKCQPLNAVIRECSAQRTSLYASIETTRKSRSKAYLTFINSRLPRYEAKWGFEDALQSFVREIADLAGVPAEWRNRVVIRYKNPDEDIQVFFGEAEDTRSRYHGHFVLHPNGTVTRKRLPRSLAVA